MSYISSLTLSRSTLGPRVSTALLLAWMAVVIGLGAPAFRTGVFDAMSTDDALALLTLFEFNIHRAAEFIQAQAAASVSKAK